MTAPEPTYPRSVTPGIETQPSLDPVGELLEQPGLYAGLDWLRVTAHDRFRIPLLEFVSRRFGDTMRGTGGAMHFKAGIEWPVGVQLSWEHRASICMLDVRGECFTLLGGARGVELLVDLLELGIPIKPTRIDLALDYVQQRRELCDHAEASCERYELVGPRRWSNASERTTGGRFTRRQVNLGKRSSSVFVRIYDKGRQLGIPSIGAWERIEVEFKQDRAPLVCVELDESGERWPVIMRDLVFGAFDFREATGRAERDRRPWVEWFTSLVAECDPKPVRSDPHPYSAEAWLNAFVQSYGRTLIHLAETFERPLGELVEELLRDFSGSCRRPQLASELASLGLGPSSQSSSARSV
ncbi:MAG: hypothetical protein DHS20C14_01590 [Phycisphaeraceae bacterium]|nr:MAG: hypothetical protein DHS20C14_01590 [Phycisphaeraceae bacterium]